MKVKHGFVLLFGVFGMSAARDDSASTDVKMALPFAGSSDLSTLDGSGTRRSALSSLPSREATEKLPDLVSEVDSNEQLSTPRLLDTFLPRRLDCCGGDGGTESDLMCPAGTRVTEFYGRHMHPRRGSWGRKSYGVDGIGIKCSNGVDLGYKGGNDGDSYSAKSDGGFTGLYVNTEDFVNYIEFWNKDGKVSSAGKDQGDMFHRLHHHLDCDFGNGYWVVGLNVRSSSLLDKIKVHCQKL